jgi:hypothetical protein
MISGMTNGVVKSRVWGHPKNTPVGIVISVQKGAYLEAGYEVSGMDWLEIREAMEE